MALPGTTRIEHLLENLGAAALTVPHGLLVRAGELINDRTVAGPRYNPSNQIEVDTELFEPSSGAPVGSP